MKKGITFNHYALAAVGAVAFLLCIYVGMIAAQTATDHQLKVSDNPLLRLDDAKKNWPPIPPPPLSQNKPTITKSPSFVTYEYNVATKMVTRYSLNRAEVPVASSNFNTAQSRSFPLSPQEVSAIIPPDDRIKISPTNEFPWRTICKLYITFPNGSHFVASGAIIGRDDGVGFHCLTAGHCVYRPEFGGWAEKVEVVPALDNDYTPFYSAWSTLIRADSGWVDQAMPEHDWACVTLDRKIGNFTGWMDRYTTDDLNWYKRVLFAAGYPTDVDFGLSLYYSSDSCLLADEYFLNYNLDAVDGQDGMPIWIMEGNSRRIVGIHIGDDGNGVNRGVRLNAQNFQLIHRWIHDDTPPPIDRPDLIDDGPRWASFAPDTVVRGFTPFKITHDVRNIGTENSGMFTIVYYASQDAIIDASSDLVLGTRLMESIPPFNWRRALWSGTFPEAIPAGKYYLGWIIDPNNEIQEFGEDNNQAIIVSRQIVAIDPYIKLKQPVGGEVFTIGESNLIEWFTAGGSGLITIDVSFDNGVSWENLVTNMPDSGRYLWKIAAAQIPAFSCMIRVTDSAKNLVAWSAAPFIVETPPTTPGAPQDEGAFTGNPSVRFTWTGATDAETGIAGYHLQVGSAPNWNNIADTSLTGELTCQITGVHNQKLYARVQARNGVGLYGPWSAASDGILIDLTAPAAPVAPQDQGEYSGTDSVSFTWQAVNDDESGVVGYHLQVGSAVGLSDLFDGWVGQQLKYIIHSTQTQQLFARIRAKNGANLLSDWSPWSDGIIVDLTPPSAPGKPYSEAEVVNFYDIPFFWDAATEDLSLVTDYHVKVVDVNHDSQVVFDQWIGNVQETLVPGKDGQALLCWVQAKNHAGLVGPWAKADKPVLVQLTPAALVLIEHSPAYEYEGWENAIDDDIVDWDGTATIYASAKPQPYAIFGFQTGGVGRIEKVKLLTDTKVGLRNRWVTHFRVLYSVTGIAEADFLPLLEAEKHSGDWEQYTFPEQLVRFVKFVIDKPDAATTQYCQVGEFQVFGRTEYVKTDKADIRIKTGTPTDPAETWSNIIDGDIQGWDGTTTALTTTPPAHVIFYFADESIKNITKIRILTDTGVRFKSRWLRNFHLETSTTGVRSEDFSVVFRSSKLVGDWESFYFDPVPAKYIKLVLDRPDESDENYCQIGEVEIFTASTPGSGSTMALTPMTAGSENATLAALPQDFSVAQNYPNPFNSETAIRYQLPTAVPVSVTIYNLRGQQIRSLVAEIQNAGYHVINWNGRDEQNQPVPSGVYLYQFKAGNFEVTRKMVFLE
jgi:V8-like Glu-specific endopeptidase